MVTCSKAGNKDLEIITRLLEINHLPYSDINRNTIDFFVAKKDGKIIGCIGLEKHGNDGLLRSFAVEIDFRNSGIGNELVDRFLKFARQNNIRNLHLLTETAKDYFAKRGFVITDRINAPSAIGASSEFIGLCPVSSTYMVRRENT